MSVRGILARLASAGMAAEASVRPRLNAALGGAARARVILVLAGVPGLNSADAATVGASATELRRAPLDAARLDIVPVPLWGRAESIRTVLRSFAQALAPLLFGAVADHVFGGGRTGLQQTFAVMLVPLAASAALLYRALRTYPADVATDGGYRQQHLVRARHVPGGG